MGGGGLCRGGNASTASSQAMCGPLVVVIWKEDGELTGSQALWGPLVVGICALNSNCSTRQCGLGRIEEEKLLCGFRAVNVEKVVCCSLNSSCLDGALGGLVTSGDRV